MNSPREMWQQAFDESPLREADYSTMSGIPLDPVYGPDDGEFPGQYPYTRGPYASMYRSKLWTMRMVAGFGTAEDTNWRFKEIIKAGGDGLSTAFDMPTLLGLDSDDVMSLGEVGRCGVAVDSLAEVSLEEALANPFLEDLRHKGEALSADAQPCHHTGDIAPLQAVMSDHGARVTG